MNTSTATIHAGGRPQLTVLGKVTFGALLGLAGSLMYVQIAVERAIEPVPTVNAAILLIVAGLLASGWRRGPLVVAGWVAFMLLGSLQVILPRFAHPDEVHMFVWNIITLVMALTALCGGITTVIQNRRMSALVGYGAEA